MIAARVHAKVEQLRELDVDEADAFLARWPLTLQSIHAGTRDPILGRPAAEMWADLERELDEILEAATLGEDWDR